MLHGGYLSGRLLHMWTVPYLHVTRVQVLVAVCMPAVTSRQMVTQSAIHSCLVQAVYPASTYLKRRIALTMRKSCTLTFFFFRITHYFGYAALV